MAPKKKQRKSRPTIDQVAGLQIVLDFERAEVRGRGRDSRGDMKLDLAERHVTEHGFSRYDHRVDGREPTFEEVYVADRLDCTPADARIALKSLYYASPGAFQPIA